MEELKFVAPMNNISSTKNQQKSKRGGREKNMQLVASSSPGSDDAKKSYIQGEVLINRPNKPSPQEIICENKSLRHKIKGEVEGPT